ncbi:hypothetical protein DY000_02003997 [Brassica cretica]|uniref:Calmodulin-binding domain-containing protein n=1 Tax=Brassica cretica TaxID=69181 RepID=A0ABQ7C7M1_BRACR|nr:hypothetical protein DY000_02003997 [Brassica cretica]
MTKPGRLLSPSRTEVTVSVPRKRSLVSTVKNKMKHKSPSLQLRCGHRPTEGLEMVTRNRCWKDKWNTIAELETAIDDCVGLRSARQHETEMARYHQVRLHTRPRLASEMEPPPKLTLTPPKRRRTPTTRKGSQFHLTKPHASPDRSSRDSQPSRTAHQHTTTSREVAREDLKVKHDPLSQP